jgi:hypothetical protein
MSIEELELPPSRCLQLKIVVEVPMESGRLPERSISVAIAVYRVNYTRVKCLGNRTG